jgi:hypothetical protein
MFKAVEMKGNAGPIQNAFRRLVRQIQTEVEHKRVTNASGSDMAKGDIAYLQAGDRQAYLTDASAEASSRWIGVIAEPIADGDRGIMRCDGLAYVRFEVGLGAIGDSDEGQQVWLSASDPGAATTREPDPGFVSVLGILADATNYSDDNPFCWVILRQCCAPTEVLQ